VAPNTCEGNDFGIVGDVDFGGAHEQSLVSVRETGFQAAITVIGPSAAFGPAADDAIGVVVGTVGGFVTVAADEPAVCSLRGDDFGHCADVELLCRGVYLADPELVLEADVDVSGTADHDPFEHTSTGHATAAGGPCVLAPQVLGHQPANAPGQDR